MDQKLPQNNSRKYYLLALRIAGDFGATIAIPVVILSIIGRNLDAKYATGLVYTVAGFVLAALITGLSIYKKAKKYGKEYHDLVNKKD